MDGRAEVRKRHGWRRANGRCAGRGGRIGAGFSLALGLLCASALVSESGAQSVSPGAAVSGQPDAGDRPRLIFTVDAYRGDLVVDSVDVAYPERLQSVRVVFGGSRLAIRGDRSVAFGYHAPTRWGVITPRADGAAVTIELPADIRAFEVRVNGEVIWQLRRGQPRANCEPVGEIVRPDGAVEWVFTPDEGRFRCEGARRPVRPA